MREIILPEAKPALEWVNGRILQKASPQRKHALAQTEFAAALLGWARATGAGDVGTEWEFRVQPPGEERRPLVPDVAFLSFDRIPYEDEAAADIPNVAPNAVVEILSPGDRTRDVEAKVRVYLLAGAEVIFLVDTMRTCVIVVDARGRRTLSAADVVEHAALPGFSLAAKRLFERVKPKR